MDLKKIIASGTLAAILLSAAPAFADSGASGKGKGDFGLHLGSLLGVRGDFKAGADFKNKGEWKDDNKNHEGRKGFFAKLGDVSAGVVTGINGAIVTIDPFGTKSTTTVTTNASTTFKVRGQATSSSALAVGSKVIVVGTTTATSTTGDIITASIVIIIKNCMGGLKHWLHIK